MDVRGRYPSEVRIILRPWKVSSVLTGERDVWGNKGEKNCFSYTDYNLRYYGIQLSCRKSGSQKPNTCYRGLDGITASYLVQIQGVGLKDQQYK